MDDGLGDWRHWAVTTLAQDLPATSGGAPAHKAGAAIYVSTITRDAYGRLVGFVMPSPTALALSVSIEASERAQSLRTNLRLVNSPTPFGTGKSVHQEDTADLYEFFEQSMVAVTFAFNAIEVFANQTIADVLRDKPYTGTTRRKLKTPNSETLQRMTSTEEKVAEIVPFLLGIASPRDSGTWSSFQSLNRIRNTTIHMKDFEALRTDAPGGVSLFHELFTARSPRSFPLVAIEVIRSLCGATGEPRWLAGAQDKLK